MFQLQTELVGGGARSIGAPEGGIYRRAAGRSPARYFRPVLDLIRQRLSARRPSQGFRGRVALVSSSGEAGSPSGHLEALMAGRRCRRDLFRACVVFSRQDLSTRVPSGFIVTVSPPCLALVSWLDLLSHRSGRLCQWRGRHCPVLIHMPERGKR